MHYEISFDNTDTSFTGTDVQEVLDEVDSKIDDITDDIKTTAWEQLTTEDTRAKFYVRRSGHIVQLYYWTDNKFETETTITTLPQKYRPTTPDYPQTVYVRDGIMTNGNSTVLKIENGGAVKINGANYDGWKQFVSTWIV